MCAVVGSNALVSLFENYDRDCRTDDGHSAHPPLPQFHSQKLEAYGALRMRKPKALTIPSTSSTTFLDQTYRGRSPCGHYHRGNVLKTTLRMSLPAPKASRAASAPTAHRPSPIRSRFDGIKRTFSLSLEKQDTPTSKSRLKPLFLASNMDVGRTQNTGIPRFEFPNVQFVRRLSLGNWLPSSRIREVSQTIIPASQPARLRPLALASKSSTGVIGESPPSERPNLLAWILDCIQRDIRPQWNQPEVDQQMLLHNGQARCLVVRSKRRSALF
ncbi:hypothetical protein CC1G_01673 [Coprinopsis cinerea okayama7|uniref:Uncharacterized protein n=1 Tax=Coprinopsis cinerea (strain Okayama-7 / 130 / ATCC MYA-4618 / FGSC 9003) TaxID=240176 RepID=A8N2H3_COPC7|nr:hypothetical protein CC1G_01673 [Coprinopsis cinerea okayama7\|eukprot:XP_001828993.2 hypothetical protein CC1G_01673 [Coprinopsis cinerea okayama7\